MSLILMFQIFLSSGCI